MFSTVNTRLSYPRASWDSPTYDSYFTASQITEPSLKSVFMCVLGI